MVQPRRAIGAIGYSPLKKELESWGDFSGLAMGCKQGASAMAASPRYQSRAGFIELLCRLVLISTGGIDACM